MTVFGCYFALHLWRHVNQILCLGLSREKTVAKVVSGEVLVSFVASLVLLNLGFGIVAVLGFSDGKLSSRIGIAGDYSKNVGRAAKMGSGNSRFAPAGIWLFFNQRNFPHIEGCREQCMYSGTE